MIIGEKHFLRFSFLILTLPFHHPDKDSTISTTNNSGLFIDNQGQREIKTFALTRFSNLLASA